MDVVGVVLAAGAGRRAGGPKALRRDAAGVGWVERAVVRLEAAGCGSVLVVLGAEAGEARRLVPERSQVVVVEDWAEGLSASLRSGLRAAYGDAALVTLVDLPDEPATVGARVLSDSPAGPAVLARATYRGRPGHPVLLGSAHWRPLSAALTGDSGARDYLARHGALAVECGDLFSGADRDGPG
ncbi:MULTISPECIES: NTP transferase domain-containing protein [unclassified Rathayibacter]|uniref:nucleotidyltransferase family protein n=1 Tax=unclassified Rathayibacter TaxID=2609250 RepID=UPI00104F5E6C|nr:MULTISPECIES: NTP transferase domain-containing protein [unclassified Rathayibacter]TCL80344.1 molybdenum cofactor cytidylyltransferase/nicotine blue oxidoreductase [Rathayibacter sp. PhB192]TCM25870.1 molybdenum cofactor cytidylyltransferase/nicotine blue oxidoreductase [Rathayibacter sp. PhB179]